MFIVYFVNFFFGLLHLDILNFHLSCGFFKLFFTVFFVFLFQVTELFVFMFVESGKFFITTVAHIPFTFRTVINSTIKYFILCLSTFLACKNHEIVLNNDLSIMLIIYLFTLQALYFFFYFITSIT
jgi:hypothetical protein